MSTTAKFVNFTEEEFTGYWDGKPHVYPAGASEFMPDYLAKHFAKHLVNRELLRVNKDGTLLYKDGDKMTSPKEPKDVPLFMKFFKKACIEEEEEDKEQETTALDTIIDSDNKNRTVTVEGNIGIGENKSDDNEIEAPNIQKSVHKNKKPQASK